MSAGLQVYNNNGYLQITKSFRNLRLIGKTTITLSAGNGYSASANIILNANTQFIAYNTVGGAWAYVRGISIVNGQSGSTIIGSPNATITYYELGYPVTQAGSYFEVYDGVGKLVFSDNAKYMKAIAAYSGAVASNNVGTTPYVINNIGIPGGITPAILVGCGVFEVAGTMPHVYYFGQVNVFNPGQIVSQVQVVAVNNGPVVGNTIYYQALNYSFLVLDVTNL
jgi:hypothetical protein